MTVNAGTGVKSSFSLNSLFFSLKIHVIFRDIIDLFDEHEEIVKTTKKWSIL